MVLQSETAILRPYTAADAKALFEAARESTTEIFPWLAWCHPDYTLAEAEEWTARQAKAFGQPDYNWMIIDPATGVMAGACGLNHMDDIHKRCNLGYWVRTSCAGRGFATAATRMISRYGLAELGLIRIEVVAAVGNEASRRVAEKSGAIYEGVLRNLLLVHDRSSDAHMFCFVPEMLAVL